MVGRENIIPETAKHLKMETRSLPCQLVEGELAKRRQELDEALEELKAESVDQADEKKLMDDWLKHLQNAIDQLSGVINERLEYRKVLVVSDLVSTTEGVLIRETRDDTGEVLELRPATVQEIHRGTRVMNKEVENGAVAIIMVFRDGARLSYVFQKPVNQGKFFTALGRAFGKMEIEMPELELPPQEGR